MRTKESADMLANIQFKHVRAHNHRGFSMMDVLIAMLVLVVGLLALGVLQGTLTRNAADARIRSQVAAYSQGVADAMRARGYDAFTSISSVTANSASCSATSPTLLQKLQCNAYTWQNSAGMSNVSTAITSTKMYGQSDGTFKSTAPTGGVSGASAQYKAINITTTWTDAQGQTRTLAYDTTVSTATVNPSDSSLDQSSFIKTSISPQVRESSPDSIPGVIPIAIGSTGGTAINAAATNPQPVQTNTGTTFSQFTYNDSSLGGELITQRVDTKVIQCRCKFAAGTGTTSSGNPTGLLSSGVSVQANQPTYWDGYHYVSPSANKNVAVTPVTLGSGSSATTVYASNTSADSAYASTNDTDCDVCCRDRNDPANGSNVPTATTTNPVLFDSFSGDSRKYAFSSTSPNLLTQVTSTSTSTSFQQACRLIRVDGIYATATDAHVDFFSLLPTGTCSQVGLPTTCASTTTAGSQTGAVPVGPSTTSGTTEASYGSFVQNYLSTNVSALSTTGFVLSGWGIGSPQTTSGTGSSASSSFIGYGLNQPTNVAISDSTSYFPWLYARAVYVDHVETAAQTAITTAGASCTGTNCILQYVPFTTVNLSGLGNNVPGVASSSPASVIIVSNTAVAGGAADGSAPTQGYVTSYSSTTNGTAYGIYTSYVTNASLTGVQPKYSGTTVTSTPANLPYDTTNTLFDQRQFTVSSASSSGSLYFDVNVSGLPYLPSAANISTYNTNFSVGWSGTKTQLGKAASGTTTGYLNSAGAMFAGGSVTTPIAVAATVTPPVGLTITVTGFNTSTAYVGGYGSETLTCNKYHGGSTAAYTFTTAQQCYSYTVDSPNITINGVNAGLTSAAVTYSGTTGGLQQKALIALPGSSTSSGISSTTNAIPGADSVVIPFIQSAITVPAGTCSCGDSTCARANVTYTAGTCSN